MNIINLRDHWPQSDVVMGTIRWPEGSIIQTLQHDPCPVAQYALAPHIMQEGPLAGTHTYALVNPDFGVFHEPNDAVGYNGTYPVRIAILFHPGNFVKDSLGCILPGMGRNSLEPQPSVGQSLFAFRSIMWLLGDGVLGHQWTILNATLAS